MIKSQQLELEDLLKWYCEAHEELDNMITYMSVIDHYLSIGKSLNQSSKEIAADMLRFFEQEYSTFIHIFENPQQEYFNLEIPSEIQISQIINLYLKN